MFLDWTVLAEERNQPVMCCCIVPTRGSEAGTNHRDPQSGRGPGFLLYCMFLSFSVVSDIIKE